MALDAHEVVGQADRTEDDQHSADHHRTLNEYAERSTLRRSRERWSG